MLDVKIMGKVGEVVKKHPGIVVAIIILITILNIYPLTNLQMDSGGPSVFAPDHEVPRAKGAINSDFPDPVQMLYTVVEAKEENILSKQCLMEMLEIERNVRADREVQEYLIKDPNNISSIAGAIDRTLEFMYAAGLENASELQLDTAIERSLDIPELRAMVSKDLVEEGGRYRAKAAIIVVQLNNTLIKEGGEENEDGQLAVKKAVLKTDLKETNVGVLAGFETEMEEGMTEGLFLLPISFGLTVLVLFFSLRRRLVDMLLSIIGIPITFIWMFGISSLIGLKMTMISFFGPILILALGIDYAIHSLHRYQEEKENGADPKDALKSSITYVGAAILLATVTTVVAFLSNVISGLPAIREFGLMIGIGIFSAFVIMGIFVPTLRSVIDELVYKRSEQKRKNNTRNNTKNNKKMVKKQGRNKKNSLSQSILRTLSKGILKISKKPLFVIPVVLILSSVSLFGALQVDTEFSEKDFMSEDSEAMAAFDMMEKHFPMSNTQRAMILVEGEVSSPEVLDALERTVNNMRDDEHVSNISGKLQVVSICPYVTEVMQNSTFVLESNISDENGDLIPDLTDDVVKVYDHLYENGIGNTTATDIRHVLHRNSEGDYDKTVIWIEATDSDRLEGMKEIKDELEEDSLALERLEGKGTINCVVTGEPVVIYIVATAMNETLVTSIVICFIACFIILLLVFRSFKFGIVTMIPVCLVAVWILGTMYALDYSFNVITILIGAISIGVGVDYSIHITHRYREERTTDNKPEEAVERTLFYTGTALFGAAATTALGFSVLVFASFGAFVAFGILTAIMIVFSFLAAIIVLPTLLLLVDRDKN